MPPCASLRQASSDEDRQRHDGRVAHRVQASSPPASSLVMLPHRLRRKAQQPEHPPPEGVREEDDDRDRHEQDRPQPKPLPRAEVQPQSEGEERQRHREREIDEAEHERMAEGERQGEHRGRRDPVVHFARDPQEAGDGHRRDAQHDQLHRRFEPDQPAERHDQQIDPEIADRGPLEAVILRKPRRMVEVELDPVATHMPEQVDQRRDRRIEQRHRGKQHERDQECGAFPPGDGRALIDGSVLVWCGRHCAAIRGRPAGWQPLFDERDGRAPAFDFLTSAA